MSATIETLSPEEKRRLFAEMLANGDVEVGEIQEAIKDKVGVTLRIHETKGGVRSKKCCLNGAGLRPAMLGKEQVEAVFASEKRIREYFGL